MSVDKMAVATNLGVLFATYTARELYRLGIDYKVVKTKINEFLV